MTLSIIDNLPDLNRHRGQIAELFESAYGRPIDIAEWEWLFGANPNGAPLVALWHEQGGLLGHTSFVPMKFSDGTNQRCVYRSGFVMIDPTCQVPGLMGFLASRLQNRARTQNVPVFGFPNDKAWLGFRLLRWTIQEGRLVDLLGSDILARPQDFVADQRPGEYALDLTDQDQLQWRLGRPSVQYRIQLGVISSEYRGVEQLLHLTSDGLGAIDPERTYRVLDMSAFRDSGESGVAQASSQGQAGTTYRFGHCSPPGNPPIVFATPQPLWSDVF